VIEPIFWSPYYLIEIYWRLYWGAKHITTIHTKQHAYLCMCKCHIRTHLARSRLHNTSSTLLLGRLLQFQCKLVRHGWASTQAPMHSHKNPSAQVPRYPFQEKRRENLWQYYMLVSTSRQQDNITSIQLRILCETYWTVSIRKTKKQIKCTYDHVPALNVNLLQIIKHAHI